MGNKRSTLQKNSGAFLPATPSALQAHLVLRDHQSNLGFTVKMVAKRPRRSPRKSQGNPVEASPRKTSSRRTSEQSEQTDSLDLTASHRSQEEEEEDADIVRILIATDNHVGYMEKDPVRGKDSINTFREILRIGKERDVDFILLGGDLFHENRPSRTTLFQVMGALREYTLGDKPVSVELLSNPYDGQAEGFE